MFEIFSDSNLPKTQTLVYRSADQSFDTEPATHEVAVSLMLNDLTIELNHEGMIMSVWGYCPEPAWKTAVLRPPTATIGRVRYLKANELTPGIGYRLNKENPWPISADKPSGWICINSGEPGNIVIEIMSGVLLQFNENRELVALWLKPKRIENEAALLGCPCCGQKTFSALGEHEICAFCKWEDDPVQSADPDYAGGANKESLTEARATWQKHVKQKAEK